MTLREKIFEILEEADSDVKNEFFRAEIRGEQSSWEIDEVTYFREMLAGEGISFELEDDFGGEDQGEDYWSVYSFTNGDETVYVKFDGWYSSYNGAEYDSFFFVEPRQVTVTQFVRT